MQSSPAQVVMLVLLVVALTSRTAAQACTSAELQSQLGSTVAGGKVDLPAGCHAFPPGPGSSPWKGTTTIQGTGEGTILDLEFATNRVLLDAGASVTLEALQLINVHLFPATAPEGAPPASRYLQPSFFSSAMTGTFITISNSVINTNCRALRLYVINRWAIDPQGSADWDTDQETYAVIPAFVTSNLSLQNVRLTCNASEPAAAPPTVIQVASGLDLQHAFAAGESLYDPFTIKLVKSITLSSVTATWRRPGGYRLWANVTLDGLAAGNNPGTIQNLVLDVRSLGALATMGPGYVMRVTNTQVQNLCTRTVPIVADRSLISVQSSPYWAVTGEAANTKVLELVNTSTIVSLHEMSTQLYWTTLGTLVPIFPLATSSPFNDAAKLGIVSSSNLARISGTTSRLLAGTAQSLQMQLQQAVSMGNRIEFRNSSLSSTPLVVVSLSGFSVGYQDCVTGRPVPFSMLSVNTTLAPIYFVNMSGSIETALTNAAANTTNPTAYSFYTPPLIVVSTNTTLPNSATARWSFAQDVLFMGPASIRDATQPGNPNTVALDLNRGINVVAVPPGELSGLYFQRITLRNLPSQPLSQGGFAWAGSGPEPAYSLPLWTFGADSRRDRSQIQLDSVTIELPSLEYASLLSAARRGNDWKGGPLRANNMVQALTAFSTSQNSLTSISVVLIEGLGMKCQNCRFIPDGEVTEDMVPTDAPPPSPPPSPPPPPPPPPMILESEARSKKKFPGGAIAGIVVGSVVLIMACSGFLYWRHKQLEKHVHMYAQELLADKEGSFDEEHGFHPDAKLAGRLSPSGRHSDPGIAEERLAKVKSRRTTGSLAATGLNVVTHAAFDPNNPANSKAPSEDEDEILGDKRTSARSMPGSRRTSTTGAASDPAFDINAAKEALKKTLGPGVSRLANVTNAQGSSSSQVSLSRANSKRQSHAGGAAIAKAAIDAGQAAQGSFTGRGFATSKLIPQLLAQDGPGASRLSQAGGSNPGTPLRHAASSRFPAADTPPTGASGRLSKRVSFSGSATHRDSLDAGLIRDIPGSPSPSMYAASDKPEGESSGPKKRPSISGAVSSVKNSMPITALLAPHMASKMMLEKAASSRNSPAGSRRVSHTGYDSPSRRISGNGSGYDSPLASRRSKRTSTPTTTQLAAALANDAGKLTLLEPIGQGGVGTVYKGLWRNMEVAAKAIVYDEDTGPDPEERAIMQAAVCTSVMHPNVVCTYHYDVTPGDGDERNPSTWKLYLVQEFCNASLAHVLATNIIHDPNTHKPDLDLLLSLLVDVACGAEYIHSMNITHGDIRPENVLLKNEVASAIGVVAKLSDFNLLLNISTQTEGNANFATFSSRFYHAPEVTMGGMGHTKMSDVYSFGVLMWELYRCMPPWLRAPTGYYLNSEFRRFPPNAPSAYVKLCNDCMSHIPDDRPEFTDVVEALTDMHDALLAGYASLEKPSGKGTASPRITKPDGIRSSAFTAYFHKIASQPAGFRFTYAYDQEWVAHRGDVPVIEEVEEEEDEDDEHADLPSFPLSPGASGTALTLDRMGSRERGSDHSELNVAARVKSVSVRPLLEVQRELSNFAWDRTNPSFMNAMRATLLGPEGGPGGDPYADEATEFKSPLASFTKDKSDKGRPGSSSSLNK